MKKTIFFTLISLVMGVAVFLFFRPLIADSLPEYAINIAAAFLGSVITIIITAILLSAQSLSELGKEKSIGVFNAKLNMYTSFLEFISKIIEDGVISENEINEFKKWAMRISLLSNSETTDTIVSFIDQTIQLGVFDYSELDDEGKNRWLIWYEKNNDKWEGLDENGENMEFLSLGLIIAYLRFDLGEDTTSSIESAYGTSLAIDNLVLSNTNFNKK